MKQRMLAGGGGGRDDLMQINAISQGLSTLCPADVARLRNSFPLAMLAGVMGAGNTPCWLPLANQILSDFQESAMTLCQWVMQHFCKDSPKKQGQELGDNIGYCSAFVL